MHGVTTEEEFEGVSFQVPSQRDTVHFTMNGEVGNNIGGNWDQMKYAIIIPLENIDTSKFVGGTVADVYSKGSVKIPEGSSVLCLEADCEKLQGELGDGIEVVGVEGDTVRGFANAFIQQKEYKQKSIGDWSWGDRDPEETVAGQVFEENEWQRVGHSFSTEMSDELVYKDIIRTSKIAAIMKNKGITVDNPETYLFSKHSHLVQTPGIFDKKEYMSTMCDSLREIAGIEVPDSIIEEINGIINGNIQERIENELKNNEQIRYDVEVLNEGNLKQYGTEHIAEYILKRRIIGEIQLAQVEQTLEKEIDFDKVLGISEYTTNDRLQEFLESRGILKDYQKVILDNPSFMQEYSMISNKSFGELSEEEMSLAYSIMEKTIDGYGFGFGKSDRVTENGEWADSFYMYNKNSYALSQEEQDKLGEAYMGENNMTGMPMLSLDTNMSLKDCLKYIQSIKEKVITREISGADLGKQTVEMQKDVEYIDGTINTIEQQEQIQENSKDTQNL